jgi:hypothetical protein
VRAVLAYINQMIDIRSKYKVPKEWEQYFLIKGKEIISCDNFWENIFDFYLLENWFILPRSMPSADITLYSEISQNYLKVIEDLYIDDYWKDRHNLI